MLTATSPNTRETTRTQSELKMKSPTASSPTPAPPARSSAFSFKMISKNKVHATTVGGLATHISSEDIPENIFESSSTLSSGSPRSPRMKSRASEKTRPKFYAAGNVSDHIKDTADNAPESSDITTSSSIPLPSSTAPTNSLGYRLRSSTKQSQLNASRYPTSLPVPQRKTGQLPPAANSSFDFSSDTKQPIQSSSQVSHSQPVSILVDNFSKLTTDYDGLATSPPAPNSMDSFLPLYVPSPAAFTPSPAIHRRKPSVAASPFVPKTGKRPLSFATPNPTTKKALSVISGDTILNPFFESPANPEGLLQSENVQKRSTTVTPEEIRTEPPPTSFFTPRPKPNMSVFQSAGLVSKKGSRTMKKFQPPDTPMKINRFALAATPGTALVGTPGGPPLFNSSGKNDVSPTSPIRVKSKKHGYPSDSPEKSNKRPSLLPSPSFTKRVATISQTSPTSRRTRSAKTPLGLFTPQKDTKTSGRKKNIGESALTARLQSVSKLQPTPCVPDEKFNNNWQSDPISHRTLSNDDTEMAASPLSKSRKSSISKGYRNLYTEHARMLTSDYVETVYEANGHSAWDDLEEEQYLSTEDYFVTHFELGRKLGEGSFAEVFRVRSLCDGKYYAVKKSKKQYPGNKSRLERLNEVRMMWKIGAHRNCTQLINAWEQHGVLYMQMELCPENLSTFLENESFEFPSDETKVWRMIADIAKGIGHIHSLNIIHLDIKPENIFMLADTTLKIGDFGLASLLPVPRDNELEGDRVYLAPEILSTRQFGKPADIFSFGLVLLEMVASVRLPGNGEDWHKLRNSDFSSVESQLESVSEALRDLIKDMLHPDPTMRPSIEKILEHPLLNVFLTADTTPVEVPRISDNTNRFSRYLEAMDFS